VIDANDRAEALRTSAFYDRAAASYDADVDGTPVNRALRDAFRARVALLAGQAGTILDFGAGTGTDAAWYAERGHRVVAYDPSAGMMAALERRCAAEIARCTIVPVLGDVDQFERALGAVAPVDVVAANFAVLNHVRDLGPLLATLGAALRPGGALVACLLNPLHRADLRRPGWWRVLALSLATGRVTATGAVTTHRHFTWSVRRMAEPTFELVERGRLDGDGGWTTEPTPWRELTSREFHVVVLRRRA
jgi:SAM-dependent methyltransferase